MAMINPIVEQEFSDPADPFKQEAARLARRRQLARSLIAQGAQGNTGAGYQGGKVFMVGSPLGNVASALAGQFMNSKVDDASKALQERMQGAQADWQQGRPATDDPRAVQDWLAQGEQQGLRTQLEQKFAEQQAARIERGEQMASDRSLKEQVARENQAARARELEDKQQFQAEQNQLYRRTADQMAAAVGRSGGREKDPEDVELDRDLKRARLSAMTAPKPVKLSASQQKALDDADVFMGHIDNAIDLAKANPNALGAKTIVPDIALQRIDPEGVATRAAVGGLAAEKVHQLSGAAVSAAEFARLRPYLPASGDDNKTVLTKLQGLRREAERIKARHVKGPTDSQASPQQSGATGGWDAKPARINSDAEFNQLPSGATFIGPDGIKRRKP